MKLVAVSSLAKRFVQKPGRSSYNSQSLTVSAAAAATVQGESTTTMTCIAAQPVIRDNVTVKRNMELRDLKQMIKSIDHFDPHGHDINREGAEEMHISHRCYLSAELRREFAKVCANFLDGKWNAVDPEKLVVKHIKGGMSNILFLVELPKGSCSLNGSNCLPRQSSGTETPCNKTLLRVYFNPELESRLVSESVVFTLLSERGIGPKLYGIFNDGRLEEFITSKTLETPDIWKPEVSRSIATKLASFHTLCLPISKKPTYLLEALERWFSRLREVRPELMVKLDFATNGKLCFADLYNEFALLRKAIDCSPSTVVFCHNDLQEGNILAPTGNVPDSDDIVVIDFEYASYNYRAFDFANHFCEWTFDYSSEVPPYFTHRLNHFPNEDQQKNFFLPYLKEMGLEHTDVSLNRLIKETKPFVPVSHFFWAVWSLVQSEVSPVKFGFLAYAEERLRMYFKLRHDLLSLIQDMNNNSNNGCR